MVSVTEVNDPDNRSPLKGSIPIAPGDVPVPSGVAISTSRHPSSIIHSRPVAELLTVANDGRDTECDKLPAISLPSSIHAVASASKVVTPS
ncbi:hypothetical protein EVG20_g11685, partial [Dentipellis fragilis]